MAASSERTGLMVVRIWTEGSQGRVYARLTETLDLTQRDTTVRTAGSVEQITSIVRTWGETFVTQSRPPL